MRHDTIASFLQQKILAKIFTYGSLASRWRAAVTALILLPWFELTKCCTPSVRLCRLYNLLQIRMP